MADANTSSEAAKRAKVIAKTAAQNQSDGKKAFGGNSTNTTTPVAPAVGGEKKKKRLRVVNTSPAELFQQYAVKAWGHLAGLELVNVSGTGLCTMALRSILRVSSNFFSYVRKGAPNTIMHVARATSTDTGFLAVGGPRTVQHGHVQRRAGPAGESTLDPAAFTGCCPNNCLEKTPRAAKEVYQTKMSQYVLPSTHGGCDRAMTGPTCPPAGAMRTTGPAAWGCFTTSRSRTSFAACAPAICCSTCRRPR